MISEKEKEKKKKLEDMNRHAYYEFFGFVESLFYYWRGGDLLFCKRGRRAFASALDGEHRDLKRSILG